MLRRVYAPTARDRKRGCANCAWGCSRSVQEGGRHFHKFVATKLESGTFEDWIDRCDLKRVWGSGARCDNMHPTYNMQRMRCNTQSLTGNSANRRHATDTMRHATYQRLCCSGISEAILEDEHGSLNRLYQLLVDFKPKCVARCTHLALHGFYT